MARLFLLFSLFVSLSAFAQEETGHDVPLDVPVLDAPFNFLNDKTYVFPSMRQSAEWSTDFLQVGHRLIQGPRLQEQRYRIWGIVVFDLAMEWIPLGSSWMHEEFHRTTMSRRGIGSYNDVNRFPIGSELIAVSHVTDEDLVRFKRDHPAEFVRMSSAGMESQVVQNQIIDRRHFFDDARSFDRITQFMNAINVTMYLKTCGGRGADSSTDDQNVEDGANVSKRDFTGLDCTAWAYDLFRPNEPYATRGTHPSGVGLDRYIRYSDLDNREKSFLERQWILSLVNFADPQMYGIDEFDTGKFSWNANLSHYITSFGYTVDANLMVKWMVHKFRFTLHSGFNNETYFPGMTLEWYEHPLFERFNVTSSVTLWNQPNDQYVLSKRSETLVAGGVRLGYKYSEVLQPYIGVEGKTPGWIAGNVFLDRNVSVWTGLKAALF